MAAACFEKDIRYVPNKRKDSIATYKMLLSLGKELKVTTLEKCRSACRAQPLCTHFTHRALTTHVPNCMLMNNATKKVPVPGIGAISGTLPCNNNRNVSTVSDHGMVDCSHAKVRTRN